MTPENKNLLQRIVEKPKQVIKNLQTRYDLDQARQKAEIRAFFAPPLQGEPTTKTYNWQTEFTTTYSWNVEDQRWVETGTYRTDPSFWAIR